MFKTLFGKKAVLPPPPITAPPPPPSRPDAMAKYSAIACNYGLSIGITDQGQVVQWGDLYYHEVGLPSGVKFTSFIGGPNLRYFIGVKEDGTMTQCISRNMMLQVTLTDDMLRGAKAISCSPKFAIKVNEDGTMSILHSGGGQGALVGFPTGIKVLAVASGNNHCVAIKEEDETMVEWGNFRRLDNYFLEFPHGVKVKAVACGSEHSVAIQKDGTMVQWGSTMYGQHKGFPKGVKVKAVACGEHHSVAIKEDGTLIQWGSSAGGVMDGFPTGVKVKAVACGTAHSVAIREDGMLIQWGSDAHRQMTGFPAPGIPAQRINAPLQTIPPPITGPAPKLGEPKFPMMETRLFKGSPIYITTIPKGTLMFRGMTKSADRKADLYGVNEMRGSYFLPKQYEVFFYPFPGIDQTAGNFEIVVIYVLTQDVKLATLINPSPDIRADKGINSTQPALTTCDTIDFGTLIGRPYDPCFDDAFLKENPDINGMIAIADADRAAFHNYKESMIFDEDLKNPGIELGLYSLYEDASDNGKKGGVPELILYPLNGRRESMYLNVPTDPIQELAFRGNNHVYAEYYVHLEVSTSKTFEAYLLDLVGSGANVGGRTMKALVDKTTGFFVDPALYSGDASNLVPFSKDAISTQFPELRFVHVPIPPDGGRRRRKTYKAAPKRRRKTYRKKSTSS